MWAHMVGFTALPHVGGFLGWFFTRKEVATWYENLKKPSFRPPNKMFPIAWTTLYTGMGYASYLVWSNLGGFTSKALVPLGLYGTQLALNWTWTPIFFGAHKLKLALINILCLYGTVVATTISWYPISKTASLLMLPYLAWLSLASSLTYQIWRDNPEEKEKST
ncbi:translocator protein [Latimeria chalumnae]|uniref:Translocator protein 2 n=1 Tax=Latimeria chalumnae TaxID=7897 RepID=M3XKF5_LATCH|nr:PREDICTED: translocator protein-like [Latimeria chalumnae]XP_014343607.1 PREDICTED: translocator protein-like [Latimeria chalumnae]|eukprot:XP_005995521.1 PREDICTED: translocator protein-like [Latimeria chalumnae]